MAIRQIKAQISLAFLISLVSACGTSAPTSPPGWKMAPGLYSGIRDYSFKVNDGILASFAPEIPKDVRTDMANCIVEFTVANMTPGQFKMLDAAAKGEAMAPGELIQQVNLQQRQAAGTVEKGQFDFLQPYCPDDIPAFKQYVRPD